MVDTSLSIEEFDALTRVLNRARDHGFVGPGPVEDHVVHAERFTRYLSGRSDIDGLDLGSGAGLPGLVIALGLPDTTWTLLDAAERRVAFLEDSVKDLGLDSRVGVVRGRAEEVARQTGMRHRFGVVVARSFGPPAIAAECATGFLAEGGVLLVSEPPDQADQRWPERGLAELHMRVVRSGSGMVEIEQVSPCPDRYPRRTGVPGKRPLF